MSYAQIGYSAYPPPSQLVGGSPPASCCEGSSPEPTMAGEASSRLMCPAQPCRLSSSPSYYGAPYPSQGAAPPYLDSFYPALGSAYGMKEQPEPLRNLTHSSPYYYDPTLAAYGYGDLDLSGPRRKAVTRDSTSTLKAWLNEHRKNPYPTKGEKIMLAIITKMTLTQVSTWFANARRRLKKENKMTWEPRTKAEMEDMEDRSEDKVASPGAQSESPSPYPGATGHSLNDIKPPSGYHSHLHSDSKDKAHHLPTQPEQQHPHQHHPPPPLHLSPFVRGPTDVNAAGLAHTSSSSSSSSPDMDPYGSGGMGAPGDGKPKIWSLADTATSKSPLPYPMDSSGLVWYSYHHTPADTPPQTPPNLKSSASLQQSLVHSSPPQFFYHHSSCYSKAPSSSSEVKMVDNYQTHCSGATETYT